MPKYARRSTRRRPGRRVRRVVRRRGKGVRKSLAGVKRAVQYANGLSVMNKMPMRTHIFHRTKLNSFSIVNPAATADLSGIQSYAMNDIASYTEFIALFQKFKILKIRLVFKYTKAATTNAQHPVLYCWKNNDPDVINASITDAYVQQLQFVRRYQFSEENREFQMSIYPYWLTRTYLSTGASGYADMSSRQSAWLDSNYYGIPHYGTAYFVKSAVGSVSELWKIDVDVEYTFAFKDVY